MLIDVNVKGCLRKPLQRNGTMLCTDANTQAKLLDAMKNGDHTYIAIALDEQSHTREVVKVTAVDGTLVITCRGVSNTEPSTFVAGSIVDTALASTAWMLDFIEGESRNGVNDD